MATIKAHILCVSTDLKDSIHMHAHVGAGTRCHTLICHQTRSHVLCMYVLAWTQPMCKGHVCMCVIEQGTFCPSFLRVHAYVWVCACMNKNLNSGVFTLFRKYVPSCFLHKWGVCLQLLLPDNSRMCVRVCVCVCVRVSGTCSHSFMQAHACMFVCVLHE